jgi:glycosyltransferase involved in cell wall biosynthesis
MKKYKAVIINPWYTPYRIPVLREVANSSEFEITVIFCTPIEPGREWYVPEDLPFKSIYLKPFTFFKYRAHNMFGEEKAFRYPKGLINTLSKIRPDVIVNLEFRIDSIASSLYALFNNCGFVLWSDMTLLHDLRMGKLRLLVRKMLLKHSKALIASCSDTKSYFHNKFSYPNEYIFTSILGNHAEESIKANNIKVKTEEDVIETEKVKFLYVGSLIPRKGLDLLIKAFTRLHVKYPQAVLTIVGDGPERLPIQKFINQNGCAEKITIKGNIPFQIVLQEMCLHDVFVFPTKLDVFGLVIAEAIACGLPVICSKYAGAAKDIVKKNGIIVDPNDTDAFFKAMEEMMTTDTRRDMTAECHSMMPLLSLNKAKDAFLNALRAGLPVNK